jgi:cholesterol oxidase
MTGWWSHLDHADPMKRRDYEEALVRGRRAGRSLELVLTMLADDLESVLRQPNHPFQFIGTATAAGLPGAVSRTQTLLARGVFKLFVAHEDQISSTQMEYLGDLAAPDGQRWRLSGFKALRMGGGVHGFAEDEGRSGFAASSVQGLWRDQTRLYFKLRPLADEAAPQLLLGILSISASDFLRQILTIRATGTTGAIEAYDTLMRFALFFGSVLRDTYGGSLAGGALARSRYAPPNWWRRPSRELRARPELGAPEGPALKPASLRVRTADGVELQLTRYGIDGKAGRSRGPVILAPGFGVRAASFAIDTVDLNLVEFLCGHGYDVWLFDYRASPELAASRGEFSIDHIARYDWPAAIHLVGQEAQTDTVKVIAHCVGAMSFMMAGLDGHLEPRGTPRIEVAILSQVAAHPIGSPLNKAKAAARLAVLLELLGWKSLRVTVHAADTYRRPLADRLLKYYPTHDPCDNPVCRRIRFVFGESYLHANLNRRTHDAIIEMFGNPHRGEAAHASLRALRHLARIVRHREVVHEDGTPYLSRRAIRHLNFRLCLMSGEKNDIFPPDGLTLTRQVLLAANMPGLERPLRIPGYGHMDCFIGAHACRDVYRLLLERL